MPASRVGYKARPSRVARRVAAPLAVCTPSSQGLVAGVLTAASANAPRQGPQCEKPPKLLLAHPTRPLGVGVDVRAAVAGEASFLLIENDPNDSIASPSSCASERVLPMGSVSCHVEPGVSRLIQSTCSTQLEDEAIRDRLAFPVNDSRDAHDQAFFLRVFRALFVLRALPRVSASGLATVGAENLTGHE